MNAERWIALKELFARALELDPEGLETFLDGVKADDADLHADLEALLTADSETTQIVDGDPGLMMEAGAEDTGGADEGDARVGSRIGPWAVTNVLVSDVGTVKLLDFGIARVMSEAPSPSGCAAASQATSTPSASRRYGRIPRGGMRRRASSWTT